MPRGPWGSSAFTPEGRARSKERVFRASLVAPFREGAWPFTLAVLAPAVWSLLFLLYKYFGDDHAVDLSGALSALLPLVVSPLLAALFKGMARPEVGKTATCGWIALGDGYIRLGMSFFRPKIELERIIDVERGVLHRGKWIPEAGGTSPVAVTGTRQVGGLKGMPGQRRGRVRVRMVMRPAWDVVAFAYPVNMDPMGELTTTLVLAGSRTRDSLGLGEGAPDEVVTTAFRELESRFRAGGEAGRKAVPKRPPRGASPRKRHWVSPEPDALPRPAAAGSAQPDEPRGLPPPRPA